MAPYQGPTLEDVRAVIAGKRTRFQLPLTLGSGAPSAVVDRRDNEWVLIPLVLNHARADEARTKAFAEGGSWMPENEFQFLEEDEPLIRDTDGAAFMDRLTAWWNRPVDHSASTIVGFDLGFHRDGTKILSLTMRFDGSAMNVTCSGTHTIEGRFEDFTRTSYGQLVPLIFNPTPGAQSASKMTVLATFANGRTQEFPAQLGDVAEQAYEVATTIVAELANEPFTAE